MSRHSFAISYAELNKVNEGYVFHIRFYSILRVKNLSQRFQRWR
jgi:hypothetical protein